MYHQQQEDAMYQKLLVAAVTCAITAIGMNINHPTNKEMDAAIIIANDALSQKFIDHERRDEKIQDSTFALMQEVLREVRRRPRLSVAISQRNGR